MVVRKNQKEAVQKDPGLMTGAAWSSKKPEWVRTDLPAITVRVWPQAKEGEKKSHTI